MAKFAKGTTGTQLDETARRPVRDRGLDFDHGTGHGVGISSASTKDRTISVQETAAGPSRRE